MPDLSLDCRKCGESFDLAGRGICLRPAFDGGGAFCPRCGEFVLTSSEHVRRAKAPRDDVPEVRVGSAG